MKNAILDALEDRYTAQISEADATIKIYLENSVGIGEHPQHLDEIDKQFQKIADAQEKLQAIKDFGSLEMPFRSEKQRKYLFAKKPTIAKKWSKKYGSKIVKKRKKK